jgi:hypothetical protein
MMEAVRTSETSVDNHFTRQYNPEDSSEQIIKHFKDVQSVTDAEDDSFLGCDAMYSHGRMPTSGRSHGAITQKAVIFILAAVRT